MRDMTHDELHAIYVQRICPSCGKYEFYLGPQGGIMRNVRCNNCGLTLSVVEGRDDIFLGQVLVEPPNYKQEFGLRPAELSDTGIVKPKVCLGCQSLDRNDKCTGGQLPPVLQRNPITGVSRWIVIYADGSHERPTAVKMRQKGSPCGPERSLYKPTLLARLLPWAYSQA